MVRTSVYLFGDTIQCTRIVLRGKNGFSKNQSEKKKVFRIKVEVEPIQNLRLVMLEEDANSQL